MQEPVKKKKNWIIPVAIAATATIAFAGFVAVILTTALAVTAPQRKISKQLKLGEKYLADANYEQAVLAYSNAITLNPKNESAYLGIAEAYLGWAGMYENGNPMMAVDVLADGMEVLKAGYDATGSKKVWEKKQELEVKKREIEKANGLGEFAGEDTGDEEEVEDTERAWDDITMSVDCRLAYEYFILNRQYEKDSYNLDFMDETTIFYEFYDMDADGVPELIMNNGSVARATRCCYAFTYSQGQVVYLGIVPTDQYTTNDGRYEGMFGLYKDSYDYENWWYYRKVGLIIDTQFLCSRNLVDNGTGEFVVEEVGSLFTKEEVSEITNQAQPFYGKTFAYDEILNSALLEYQK